MDAHRDFPDHEDLCVPPEKFHLKSLYLLARSVIIRHFTYHLPKSHPEIRIHSFSSVGNPTFKEYLESSGVYFVMCHDGAYVPIKPRKNRPALDTSVGDWQKVTFRKMIGQFISLGFNVALINGLEVRDTKVRRAS